MRLYLGSLVLMGVLCLSCSRTKTEKHRKYHAPYVYVEVSEHVFHLSNCCEAIDYDDTERIEVTDFDQEGYKLCEDCLWSALKRMKTPEEDDAVNWEMHVPSRLR